MKREIPYLLILFIIIIIFPVRNIFSQTTIILQPDSIEGKDAILRNLEPNINHGKSNYYMANAWTWEGVPGLIRSLLEFDLSVIPDSAEIIEAKLSLYYHHIQGSIPQTHSSLSGPNISLIQRITIEWEEDNVTWNTQPQIDTTNQVVIPQSTSPTQDYPNINVIAIVQDMIENPLSSHGFLFRIKTEEHYRRMVFASTDHPVDSLHPKLVITFITCSINLGNDTTICFGDELELTPGSNFMNYLWHNGSTDSIFIVDTTGLYWVEVTDSLGCIATDSIFIELLPSPEINLGNDTLICLGDSLILNAGGGYLSYIWNTGSNDSTIVVDSTGIYCVEVENEFGCTSIDSILIEIYPFAWEDLDLGSDTIFCFGESIVLNAGSGYTYYQWQDGSSDSIFIADTAGIYYVYVENPCGSGSDTIVLDVYPVINIDLGNDTALCSGESALLDPGFGYLSYLWQDGSSNQFFYANQTGAYWVQVMDDNFCYAYDTINLEFILPDPDIGSDTTICSGDSVTFYLDDGFVNYLWQDGSVLPFFTADSAGMFWCEVIDTLGCVGRDSVFLNIIFPPLVSLGNDTSFCFGDSLWLNILPYGNNYNLTWQDGSEDSVFLVTQQGNYWVLALNQCGTDSDSVFVNVRQLPFVFLGNDTILGMNDYLILDAGSGFESYLWNDDSYYQTLTIDEAGNYWVNVFDGMCYNTDTINIEPVDCEMLVPIVITPNWDGDNDYFFANTSEDIYDFSLIVFSRWGEKIWETEVKDDKWDGTKNGKPAADGTYYWITKYKCLGSPQKFIRRGSVTVLR